MKGFAKCSIAGLGPLWLPEVRCDRSQRPWWEAARLHSMHHYIQPGERLLDIGAEMGDLSCLFASWGVGMFLVEPNPKAWPWIASTFEANQFRQRVHGWYVGLLGSERQSMLEAVRSDRLSVDYIGDGALGWPDWCANDEMDPATGFYHLAEHAEVSPVTTVDDLVNESGFTPTSITMDVEGGEMDVLYGALNTLEQCQPKVWVSIHPDFMADQYGYKKETLLDFMVGCDYTPVFLATDHEEHWMFLPESYGWRW